MSAAITIWLRAKCDALPELIRIAHRVLEETQLDRITDELTLPAAATRFW